MKVVCLGEECLVGNLGIRRWFIIEHGRSMRGNEAEEEQDKEQDKEQGEPQKRVEGGWCWASLCSRFPLWPVIWGYGIYRNLQCRKHSCLVIIRPIHFNSCDMPWPTLSTGQHPEFYFITFSPILLPLCRPTLCKKMSKAQKRIRPYSWYDLIKDAVIFLAQDMHS